MEKWCFGYVVDRRDNVGIALETLKPGQVRMSGARRGEWAEVCEPVPEGHKFALRPIEAGEPVIKFGGRIGTAIQPIPRGAYVHLHNMKSDFDDYAATLDVETALDNQIVYHLEQEDMDR